jgi:hypothetical protein
MVVGEEVEERGVWMWVDGYLFFRGPSGEDGWIKNE